MMVKTPFIPAAACPGRVHRYGNFPLAKTTLGVADLPGAIVRARSARPRRIGAEARGEFSEPS